MSLFQFIDLSTLFMSSRFNAVIFVIQIEKWWVVFTYPKIESIDILFESY